MPRLINTPIGWPCISIAYDQSLSTMKKSGRIRKYFRFNKYFMDFLRNDNPQLNIIYRSAKVVVDEENHLIGFKFFVGKKEGDFPLSHNKKGHMSMAAHKILDNYDWSKEIHLRHIEDRKFFPYRFTDDEGKEIWVIELDKPGRRG